MKKMFFILACLMCTAFGFAALPPFYQSSIEIERILNDPRTNEKLGSGQMILDIKRVENGWLIVTPRYQMNVDVNYIPTGRVGPASFELEFHDPIGLEEPINFIVNS
jgi:hypothetical protein